MSNPQRLYMKGFQFLVTRKRNTFKVFPIIQIKALHYNKKSHPLNRIPNRWKAHEPHTQNSSHPRQQNKMSPKIHTTNSSENIKKGVS